MLDYGYGGIEIGEVSWGKVARTWGCFKMDVIEMLDLVRDDLAESFGITVRVPVDASTS